MKIKDRTRTLFESAERARKKAHAPYSHFRVGASVVTAGGAPYTGCNIENASYGATVCAERVAILKAVSEGAREFSEIVIVAKARKLVPPCALCLQMMAEFCHPDFLVYLATPTGIKKSYKLSQLLPHPFNAKFL